MSNVVKDKFLTDFEKHQEDNGMYGAKRYTDSDNKKWKATQPLTAEQTAALERRDKKGFVVLVVGVVALLIGAIIICMVQ